MLTVDERDAVGVDVRQRTKRHDQLRDRQRRLVMDRRRQRLFEVGAQVCVFPFLDPPVRQAKRC